MNGKLVMQLNYCAHKPWIVQEHLNETWNWTWDFKLGVIAPTAVPHAAFKLHHQGRELSRAELKACWPSRRPIFVFQSRFWLIFRVSGGGKTHNSHFSSFLMAFFIPFFPAKWAKPPPNVTKNETKNEAKMNEKWLSWATLITASFQSRLYSDFIYSRVPLSNLLKVTILVKLVCFPSSSTLLLI